jgi:hypothetical protein
MGVRAGATTCANVDMGSTGPQQRPGADVDCGARGQHIVDQDQAQASNIGLVLGRHPEGALHVMGECVSSGLAEATSFMLQR